MRRDIIGGECGICAHGERRVMFEGSRGHFTECVTCGSWTFLERQGDGDTAAHFYTALDQQRYRNYFRPFRMEQYRDILSDLIGDGPRGRRLIDIGSGYGWLLEVAQDLGWEPVGVEPGEIDAEPRVRHLVRRQSLAELARGDAAASADIVTMWHVLEHLPHLEESIGEVRTLINGHGLLLIAVPNARGRVFRLAVRLRQLLGSPALLDELFYVKNPNMHYHYFTAEGLTALLARNGFHVVRNCAIESFDWDRLHVRVDNRVMRAAIQVIAPLLGRTGVSRRENLIVLARRSSSPDDRRAGEAVRHSAGR